MPGTGLVIHEVETLNLRQNKNLSVVNFTDVPVPTSDSLLFITSYYKAWKAIVAGAMAT